MKRTGSILLALAVTLSLCACGAEKAPESAVQEPEISFTVDIQTYEEQSKAPDGTVLAICKYELPQLHAFNEEGEEVYALHAPVPESSVQTVSDPLPVFQLEMAKYLSEKQTYFHEISTWAQEHYDDVQSGELSLHAGYVDEMSVESIWQSGDLISIYATFYTDTGGAHPNGGFVTWNYDLTTGEFLTYEDFTDREERFRAVVAGEILAQIAEQGMGDFYYEDYASYVRDLAYTSVYFDDAGMTVLFEEYSMGPHAAGIPTFSVPYEAFARFLSERGSKLLDLGQDVWALSDFREAQELWYYFNMCTMPLNYDESPVMIDGNAFYHVTLDGFSTMDDLRARLSARFSGEIAESLLSLDLYRDINGVLYGKDAARGSDLSIGGETCSVRFDGGDGGVITVKAEQYDLEAAQDPESGEWPLKDEALTFEFPFILTKNGAQFTRFESIR